MDHLVAWGSFAAILWEQGERARTPRIGVERFDRPAPSFGLGGIDLAEAEHVALDHTPAIEALVLDDAPIEMRLAVLSSLGSS
jgi:hypothetical protein